MQSKVSIAAVLAFLIQTLGPHGLQAAEPAALAALRQQKLDVANKRYDATQTAFDQETANGEALYAASIAWKGASCEIAANTAQRIVALEAHRDRIKRLYDQIHAWDEAGDRRGGKYEDLSARFWLLEAEIWILETKQKAVGKPGHEPGR